MSGTTRRYGAMFQLFRWLGLVCLPLAGLLALHAAFLSAEWGLVAIALGTAALGRSLASEFKVRKMMAEFELERRLLGLSKHEASHHYAIG